MDLDTETKIYALVLYLIIAPILGFLIKNSKKMKGTFYKISHILFWFTFIFISLWEIMIFTQFNLLYEFLLLLSLFLAPILFLAIIIFLIYYGTRSIIKQDTYVKLFFLPIQLKGTLAVYFGTLFLVTGLYLLLFWGGLMGIFLCKGNNIFCSLPNLLEKPMSIFGNALELIIKPVEHILNFKR